VYAHPQHDSKYDVQRLRKQAGRWLKSLRERAGLSQRQLAERVGLDYYSFVSQLEAGRGRVPPERYQVWAHALEVEPKAFVKGIMRYYDPVTYAILFDADGADAEDPTEAGEAAAPAPANADEPDGG